MGQIKSHTPVVLIAAVSSRYQSAIEWLVNRALKDWGPTSLSSSCFDFTETGYYQPTMGDDLKKQLLAFGQIDPAVLPDLKIQANAWEEEYATSHSHPEIRPLNVDPGYISQAKLVLATTKDRDHRIYLRDGIYAEVTLHFHNGKWESSRWTYPDYQRGDFQSFFTDCRNHLRKHLRRGSS